MSGNNKITVVIPHKNQAEFLEQALASVYAQTYQPFEVIVVDDASDNGQKDKILGFRKQHEWDFKWIELSKASGPSVARNEGIKQASGDFIALLDADDYWSPQHLLFFIKSLKKHKDLRFYSSRTILSEKEILFPNSDDPVVLKGDYFEFAVKNPLVVNSSSVIVKRELFQNSGLFHEEVKVFEDMDRWIALGRNVSLYFQDNPTVLYRKSSLRSLSTSIEEYKNPAVVRMIKGWWTDATTGTEKEFIQLNYFGYWMRFVKAWKKPPPEIHKMIKPEYLNRRNKWIYRLLKNFF